MNGKLKHTPGPWKPCRGGDCECGFVYGEEYIIAQVKHKYDDIILNGETVHANSLLIAAAPEMLECIIEIYVVFKKEKFKTADILKLIIEKATGLKIGEVIK